MLVYDWKYTFADSDLPKVRGATQLAGVSVGYPFLSRELTDLSLCIPPDWKLKRMKLRWFFKEALRDFLPKEDTHQEEAWLRVAVWAVVSAPRGTAKAGRGVTRRHRRARHRAKGVCPRPARQAPARGAGVLRRNGVDTDDAGTMATNDSRPSRSAP